MRPESGRILLTALALALAAVVVGVRSASTQDRTVLDKALDSDGDLGATLTALDRQILEFVNDSQLEELLNGTDPADIYLSNGETLQALTTRTQAASSRHLLFAPVAPCRLLDTRQAVEGRLLAGETRGFRVRETEDGYAAQGGQAEGCALPGLSGMTLKTNTVRALALNIMTTEVGGPGSLAIWPANRSEPEIGAVSFAGALAGGGVTGGVLVPVCDEAGLVPCGSGDLKIKAKISGAHVVADVVGYFHAADASLTPINELATEEDGADDVAGESGRPRESTSSASLPSPRAQAQAQAQAQPAVRKQLSNGLPSVAINQSVLPPYPLLPNPHGGHAKIRTALSTGDAELNIRQAIDAHLDNQTFAFNLNAIRGTATTGNAIYGLAPNGRAIYGQTEDGYALYGFDGGSAANRGYAGYFYSTNGIGVYGYSGANRTHPNILAPGVYGQSNQGVGVYGRGDTSNSWIFFNEGGYFEGGKGLYARGTDNSAEQGYGARIFSNEYRGMYVQASSSWFDAFFGGDSGISTNGIVNRAPFTQTLAVNLGNAAIEPGDLVSLVGVAPSPEHGQPMLGVAKLDAGNRDAVIGVAHGAFSAERISFEDGSDYTDFSPIDGAVASSSYLTIVTAGLAPAVKLSSLAGVAGWQIGDRIALSTDGEMELARRGVEAAAADAVSIGKLAAPLDPQNGTVAIFIDID
jgi:hypothetical protein